MMTQGWLGRKFVQIGDIVEIDLPQSFQENNKEILGPKTADVQIVAIFVEDGMYHFSGKITLTDPNTLQPVDHIIRLTSDNA